MKNTKRLNEMSDHDQLQFLIDIPGYPDMYTWVKTIEDILARNDKLTDDIKNLTRVLVFHPDAHPKFIMKLKDTIKNTNL